jgi:hypothetical protein
MTCRAGTADAQGQAVTECGVFDVVASIGPFWDANESSMVLGGGVLLIAFPAALGGGADHTLSAGHVDADGTRC